MTIPYFLKATAVVAPEPLHTSDAGQVVEVLVYDRTETIGALVGAVVEEYSGTLLTKSRTDVATAKVTIPAGCPGLAWFRAANGKPKVGFPWVRIEADGVPRFRGYLGSSSDIEVNWQANTVTFTLTAMVGLLDRVVFGDAQRSNEIVNGDMEDGTSDWATGGADLTIASTTFSRRGTKGLQLNVGASGGYAYQFVSLPLSPNTQIWHVAAEQFRFPGQAQGFGLVVTLAVDGDVVGSYASKVPSELEHATGTWLSWICDPIHVDGGHSSVVLVVALHAAPFTNPVWDEAVASRNENTSVTPGNDVSALVATAAKYALDKLDLPTGRQVFSTGTTLADGYTYPHSEHAQILSAMLEWPQVEIRYDAVTDRIIIAPRIGVDRDDLCLADGWAPVIESVDVSGAATATRVISNGPDRGDEVTRMESAATLPDADIILEDIDQAPDGITPKDLDKRPLSILAQRSEPGIALKVSLPTPSGGRCPADWLERKVIEGDSFPSRLAFGQLMDFDGTHRLASWTVRGNELEAEFMDTVVED